MRFIKNFLINLGILLLILLVLLVLFPQMRQVLQAYWTILGPVGILVILVAALPQVRKRR